MRTFFWPAIFLMRRFKISHKMIIFSIFVLLLYILMLFRSILHLGTSAIALTFVALVLIYYFFLAFYFSTMRTITILQNTALRISKGDFTVRVDEQTLDEFSDIGESFNQIADAFQTILTKQ